MSTAAQNWGCQRIFLELKIHLWQWKGNKIHWTVIGPLKCRSSPGSILSRVYHNAKPSPNKELPEPWTLKCKNISQSRRWHGWYMMQKQTNKQTWQPLNFQQRQSSFSCAYMYWMMYVPCTHPNLILKTLWTPEMEEKSREKKDKIMPRHKI